MFFLSFPRSAPVRKLRKKSFLFYAQGRRKTKTFQFFQKSLHLPLYKIEISGIIIIVRCASVAQSVEQGTENPRVIGSIPIGGTSQGNPAGFPICGRSSSGRAPPCQGGGSEFEPRRPLHLCGSLAQLGEHLPYKQRVSGSSPLTSTMWPGSSVG